MKIAVCVKQTPIPAEAHMDPATKAMVRDGVALTISSIDRRALLEALRLRDVIGGSVTVLTMGPPLASSALTECLALGADNAVHISDPSLAGSDTLVTAWVLSRALAKLKPDLVVCGKFSIDSETGQVPSQMAEFLDLPQITSVRKIHAGIAHNSLILERETDEGYQQYEMTTPGLISVTELIIGSRRPDDEEMEVGKSKPIRRFNLESLRIEPSMVGSLGSPTWVGELRSAGLKRNGKVIAQGDPEDAARNIASYMVSNGLFKTGGKSDKISIRPPAPINPDLSKEVCVVSELSNGSVRAVTLELLGEAQRLAQTLGGGVSTILIGGAGCERFGRMLGAYGADTVYVASSDILSLYRTDTYTSIVSSTITDFRPFAVLFGSTTNGRDLAPRVAARLKIGLTGDCVGFEFESGEGLAQLKPAFGGDIVSPIFSRTTPIMATVRPGVLNSAGPDWSIVPKLIPLDTSVSDHQSLRLLHDEPEPELESIALDSAETIIGVGIGIGGPENLPVIRELNEAVGGAIGGTLQVAVARWLPPQLQIGLTGRSVAPVFHIAIGLSGQPNYLVGVKNAKHIIAINNDPEAPIFSASDFGVIGDWKEIVPCLTRVIREIKGVA